MQIVKRIYYMLRSFEKKMRVKYYRQVREHRFMWSIFNLISGFSHLKQASAALTYHTIFAIVPVLSLMIAIAKGLGYDQQFKLQLQSFFHGQEEVSNRLLDFAGSYLSNTQVSVWWGVGIGIILLLYSVFSIFQTIDVTFNLLWNESGRSFKTLLKTFAFVMVIPFVVIIALGLWWSISSIFNDTPIKELHIFIISVASYILVLLGVYKFIPKTYVKLKYAALSAVVCGVIFGVMQYFGYTIISMFSSYRNVYGDLATMIIFLLWIYLSWTICLAGSRWNYFLQKADEQEEENKYNGISYKYFKFIMLLIIERVESVYPFSGQFDADLLAENVYKVYGIPSHVVMDMLQHLRLHKILFNGSKGTLYLNPKYSEFTVKEFLEELDYAGRNSDVIALSTKIHENTALNNLWQVINGDAENETCMNVQVRDILGLK